MQSKTYMKKLRFVLPFVLLVSPLAVTSCGNSSESVDNISYTVKKEPTCLEAGLEEGYDKDGNLISRPNQKNPIFLLND